MEEEAAKAFDQLHIKIDPKAMMKDLTVGYQQMVEIAKAISTICWYPTDRKSVV